MIELYNDYSQSHKITDNVRYGHEWEGAKGAKKREKRGENDKRKDNKRKRRTVKLLNRYHYI